MRRQLWLLVLAFAATAFAQQPSVEDRVNELLSKMTLEEKLGQLIQLTPGRPEFAEAMKSGQVGSLLGTNSGAQVNELQRAAQKTRLKIPLLIGHDIIHGHRTIFPIPLAIASGWDPELAEAAARVGAREALAAGIDWTFAPMVDIARDARWGRIAEGAGEDPFLGSAMAAAWVRGYQDEGMLACAKHFAAYGAAEGGRDYDTTDMSEAQLRQVYLPPFKAANDAGVASYMSAFNALNGVPATANAYLLDQILRKEWGFRGFVVSDWTAVHELILHGVASTREESAIKAITAGVDMNMVDNNYMTLAGAVREGRLQQSVVDEAVRRVLRAKFRAGLFENPFVSEKPALRSKAHLDESRRVAHRSIVLLKNERSVLPLRKTGQTIAVIGPLADSKDDMLGPWAAEGKAEETVSVLEGLRAALGASTRLLHAKGTGVLEGTDQEITSAAATASGADVIIAVLGEARDMSAEAASRASIDLPGRQQQLLERLVATRKPVVLVVMAGRPLSISWAAEHVAAIAQTWFLGSEGGHAVADILFGDVSPSGKLPVTIPRATGQVPIYYSHLRTGRPPHPDQKYTSKYIDVPIGPLYPFGHGLTYTKFAYRDLRLSAPQMSRGGALTVSAEVRNSGSRAGEEIVQLYMADPVASVSRPVKELKGFQKIALQPGQSRRVEFAISEELLQFWSEKGWTVEPGQFRVWIAPSSVGGLETTFTLSERSAGGSPGPERSRRISRPARPRRVATSEP